ncbi:MAG: DNA repair protein RadC [Rhodospirillales bacterium]|nr:DNA repair protein RadC [Rhodospirillales bacterium]
MPAARRKGGELAEALPAAQLGTKHSITSPAVSVEPPVISSDGDTRSAEDATARLKTHGLVVSNRVSPEGEVTYYISGETHPARHLLREAGGRWDAIRRVWAFHQTDPSTALADHLGAAPAERGAETGSDSASSQIVGLANRPHYWGHRQRLRDRFLAGDDNALPDYELLELLLFFSIQRSDTKPLAKALLARFGSLAGVVNGSSEQVAEFEGVNHFTLTLFKLARIMAARLVRADLTEKPVLGNWDALIDYLRATMAHRMVEQFRLLFLDRRNVLIADEVQQEGTIDHTPLYTREVVKRALSLDATAIIMVHNHPSNHPAPSKPDIQMTKQVRDALDRVGIVLHDHLIISRRGHTSFRQMGIIGG